MRIRSLNINHFFSEFLVAILALRLTSGGMSTSGCVLRRGLRRRVFCFVFSLLLAIAALTETFGFFPESFMKTFISSYALANPFRLKYLFLMFSPSNRFVMDSRRIFIPRHWLWNNRNNWVSQKPRKKMRICIGMKFWGWKYFSPLRYSEKVYIDPSTEWIRYSCRPWAKSSDFSVNWLTYGKIWSASCA